MRRYLGWLAVPGQFAVYDFVDGWPWIVQRDSEEGVNRRRVVRVDAPLDSNVAGSDVTGEELLGTLHERGHFVSA